MALPQIHTQSLPVVGVSESVALACWIPDHDDWMIPGHDFARHGRMQMKMPPPRIRHWRQTFWLPYILNEIYYLEICAPYHVMHGPDPDPKWNGMTTPTERYDDLYPLW